MKEFTTGSIAKPLLAFAAPMMVGNLFQQLYVLVDAIVVGRYVGGGALAAVGISMNVVIFLTSVLIGLNTGAAVVIAQFFGARHYERLKSAVSVSMLFLFALSIVLTVLGVVFAPHFLRLLNTDPEIFDNALLYMRIMMGGMVFPIFYNMYTAYMRALGDSRHPLYILIFTVVLSGSLSVYLVVVQGWGVAGAAASTVFSQFIATILCYFSSRRYTPLLKLEKFTFDFSLFRLIIKYGAPTALQMSLVSLATLTITRLINSFGASAMAGITAVGRIDQFAIMPVSTVSMAMSTFVAQNMGADLEDRARKGFHTALVFMLICSVFMSALMMTLAPQLISLFLDQGDPNLSEILRIGREYLNIMVIFYFLFAFLFAFNGFFRGVGDVIAAMVGPVFSLILRTVSAYSLVGYAGMGPEALAWSIPIGWGVSSLGCFIYYKKRLWAGKTAT